MKCLETRKYEGYTRRRYRRDDGSATTTYEIDATYVQERDIKAFIRRAAGKSNLVVPKKVAIDPDKVDAVLEALDTEETHRSIAIRLGVSTRTIQKIKRGY